MAEQVIGTARIDIAGDTSGVEAAAARAKKSIADMADSGQAQYSRLSRAEKRRIDSLVSQQKAIRDAVARQLELNDSLGVGNQALDQLMRRVAFSPWTAAAGGVMALALAWKQGNEELRDLDRHLALTGNTLGITSNQVSAMAAGMESLSGVTRGEAVAVLTEVAKSGKIASDRLRQVAEVAIQSNQLLGRSISEVVDEYARLGDEPSKGVAELNKQYGFLTVAVYEQITSLEKEGRTQDAARLAQETLAASTKSRLEEVKSQLGYVERAWLTVRQVASGAWDAMRDAGRSGLVVDLENAKRALEKAKSDNIYQRNPVRAQQLDDEIATLEMRLVGELETARAQQREQERVQRYISAAGNWNSQGEQFLTRAQRREKEIESAKKWAREIGATEEALAERILQIREKYKDKAGGGHKSDAAERTLGSLRQQEAALRAQVESSDRLTSSQAALAKFEQQIADLKTKKTLSADEKSLLAAEGRLRSQHETNAALEREAEAKKVLITLDERSAQIAEQMSLARQSTNDQYQRQLDAFGFGDKAMERVQAQRNIYREFERRQEDWAKLAAKAGALESDVYKRVSKEIDDELKRRLAGLENYHTVVDELQRSWNRGATQGLANYSDEAANVFKSVSGFATESFRGMEDAIVEFARTGKLSFSDMTNSIIGDMLRIVTQQSITGPLAGVLGKSIGSWFGGGAPAPAGVTPGLDYLHANAKGNVFDSPSLSRYSNGVYNSPQFFEFAKGAGVFAEAGPEAIMPLKRGSDGSLGVRAEMPRMPAMGAAIPEINVNVHGVQGQPEVSARRNPDGGIDIDILVKRVSNQLGAEVAAGQGGLSRGLESRFVLTKRLG